MLTDPRPVSIVGPVLPAAAPLTIAIPAIGVRSRLLSLGLTDSGAMQVPSPGPHYDQAGWYRYSPTPGSVGPAIIVGHVDSAAHGPSVFFLLGNLRPHDVVRVTRADGTVAVFSVNSVRRYAKSGFPTHLVYANTYRAVLWLITCSGPFDRTSGHYLDNTVVRATLVRTSGGPARRVAPQTR